MLRAEANEQSLGVREMQSCRASHRASLDGGETMPIIRSTDEDDLAVGLTDRKHANRMSTDGSDEVFVIGYPVWGRRYGAR